ncbi:carbohydrate ABC transporter permease [Streptococcus gallinaceus]|uniref:Lactose/L-arabinose transport system permease protein n=1 Tax=Streptococcus gallinaceus TaxID=165758 RepID=A0ABV2JMJ3_9STRE|nr:carbohydrate ABC transporter permease [Streptococcus gallinaceus]MCP1638922.1 lactose/L-arabinose transport system permease protein [Streptococcus gallinaceus]MCP1769834.1 lactose/L-arabinose transport system permease protein [Streptococcus gallinaceus]
MTKNKNIGSYIFLGLMSIVFAFPFYFLLVSATNKSIDVTNGRLLPGGYFFENLKNLFETADIARALKNSAVISVLQTVLALFFASLAGYGFEIYRSKYKDIVFNVLMLAMMIPFASLMIPLFRLFGSLSNTVPIIGIDTYAAAILPYISTAFLIFYFRQNTKMFPKDLLEAGRIDGLSELGCFIRIYMPSMKTTYAAAGIITFLSAWNNYLWPLIVLQTPENQTIPLLISNLGSSYSPDYGVIMTAIVLATLPTALIFFILQKHFVAGMLGSIK